jgi:hypothetical protein
VTSSTHASTSAQAGKGILESQRLTAQERSFLLSAARTALGHAVKATPLPPLDKAGVPPRLWEPGASFVTLTISGNLRGCIGALEAHQALVDDVREHAAAAAVQDYRFPPVQPRELAAIRIEVSRLTASQPLEYSSADDLLSKLRPGVDGVVLRQGPRRATFLPQVWEKIPDPADFLDNLCYKMGVTADHWRGAHLDVRIYQVEEFHE